MLPRLLELRIGAPLPPALAAVRQAGVVKMNVDTDTQWAYWEGIKDFYQVSQLSAVYFSFCRADARNAMP